MQYKIIDAYASAVIILFYISVFCGTGYAAFCGGSSIAKCFIDITDDHRGPAFYLEMSHKYPLVNED